MSSDEQPRVGTHWEHTRFGGWTMTADPVIVEALGTVGFDFVGLDLQHGFYGFSSAARALQVLNLIDMPAYVRISVRELDRVPQHLDAGADGVILAMVTSADEVDHAVRSVRYQPAGERSYGGHRYGLKRDPEDLATHTPRVYPMIETAAAFAAVADIATRDGVAGLYVGPVDLAMALGCAPVLHDETFVAALRRVVDVAQSVGVRAGCFAVDGEHAADLAALGFSDVVIASDIATITAMSRQFLTQARQR